MRDILFMSRVLAFVSHEMQNIMAIIKESGALVNDVLLLNGPPKLKHGDKLMNSLDTIQQQVLRGRSLMLSLNGFAHAAEDYPDCCDIARFGKQIGVVALRMAQLKGCPLNLLFGDKPILVEGNAFFVMQSIYLAVVLLLHNMQPGEELIVQLDQYLDLSTLALMGAQVEPEDTEELKELMSSFGGYVEHIDNGIRLVYLNVVSCCVHMGE